MSKETKDALWERLEALVIQWKALGEGDDAVRLKLNVEMSEILGKLYPWDNAKWANIGAFWRADMPKFDPAEGTFRSFMEARLELRKQDAKRKESGMHRKTVIENGEKVQKWVQDESLNAPASPDGEDTREKIDELSDSAAPSPQARVDAREMAGALLSLILDLPTKLRGQANNPARVRYYRMFFTDEATDIIARGGGAFFLRHERDLFRAMYLAFLDFFMDASCRTVAAVERAHLKPYGEMVPGRPMEEATQPLPIDVYTQYLRTEGVELRSDATISNQRDAYRTFKRENLL